METDSEESFDDKAVMDIKIKALKREHATGNIFLNLTKSDDNNDSDDDRFLIRDIDISFKQQVEDNMFLFQVSLEKINIADMELLVIKKPHYSNAFDRDCGIEESPMCDCGGLIDFKWKV